MYLRTYFCSQTSKASYIYPPVELLVLSGIIAEEYDVELVDAIADRLDSEVCEKKILSADYHAIVFLTGYVSWREDFTLMEKIKQAKPDTKLVAIGDIMLSKSAARLREHPFIDAVILDFTTAYILTYFKGGTDVRNMVFRKDDSLIEGGMSTPSETYEIPVPKHELFMGKKYTYPLVRKLPMTTVLTDYGCVFNCAFCVYGTFNFKCRTVDNVMAELNYIRSLEIPELFFLDQTFGSNRERTVELCTRMVEERLNFSWFCFSRVDVVDKKTLSLMKQAGCHTVIFGVESADPGILKRYKKGYTPEKIKETFRTASELGLTTVGTFLLGLPEEDKRSCYRTIAFARELDCDFASFNIAVPRYGTRLREQAISGKLIDRDTDTMDQAGSFITMPTRNITVEEMGEIRKKAYIDFYFRIAYIWRRLKKIRSLTEFKNQVTQALGIVRNIL